MQYASRFSFCCSHCHKRRTSPSVRFFGRRVYLALVLLLMAGRRAGLWQQREPSRRHGLWVRRNGGYTSAYGNADFRHFEIRQ